MGSNLKQISLRKKEGMAVVSKWLVITDGRLTKKGVFLKHIIKQ